MRTIKELMNTNLIGVYSSESLVSAYKKMHTHEIRHLPVFDGDQKIIGILSDRDILRAIVLNENKMESKISDFMTWPILKVNERESLVVVINKIQSEKVSGLIVENDFGVPVGIITTEDLILCLQDVLQE
jgi:CBS domain-containing protein